MHLRAGDRWAGGCRRVLPVVNRCEARCANAAAAVGRFWGGRGRRFKGCSGVGQQVLCGGRRWRRESRSLRHRGLPSRSRSSVGVAAFVALFPAFWPTTLRNCRGTSGAHGVRLHLAPGRRLIRWAAIPLRAWGRK
ncbi:hypothetical protein TraAM80_10449 [Trypanosoma rangeli]|uniref:Uncharacterized protein n=1 Tax=Trypanosoma rangeli TaxID=5698 RepID=A0A3R7M351_TRYRA|nr:uncharacterized protein TraAM80_10449 [Trypanosoma rangeli]RNE95287.1 hypothetical protein TraAM80_10449 [Trypanosoma rangeli]|eukprot:RNE95287.1 hypothetical protein TraAM80_10449 [Trypanosoma rangeli]